MNRITQSLFGVSRNLFRQVAVVCCLLFMGGMAFGQINITSSTPLTQNFDGTVTAPPVNLPSNWKISPAGASAPTWSDSGNFTSCNFTFNSGSPATGGRYNWGNGTTTTDRAVGFMTSGSYNSPNSLMVYYRNTSGSQINDLVLSFDYERYRINTSACAITFFTSTNGSTWTARTAGDSGNFSTGSSTYTFTGGTVIAKSFTLSGVNIPNNGDFYLRWNFDTTGGNSQGVGLDNLSVTPTIGPTPTISTTGALAAVNTTYGSASATPTSFFVSGANMTAGILVTPPSTNFEVSLTSGGIYANTITVGAAGTINSTEVFVRLKNTATVAGSPYSGNIVLSSAGATNVNVATVSSTVSPLAIVVSNAVASNKVYNANNTATITGGVVAGVNGDVLSLSGGGTFAQTSVGTGITVTTALVLSGTNATSYSLTQPTGLSANITASPLTITGVIALNKTFDGTATATLSGAAVLNGVIGSDNVILGGTPVATFASSDVGTGIAVTVTDYAISGAAAGNYSLTQPTGLSANIIAAAVPNINSVLTRTLTYGAVFSTYTITASNSPTDFNATPLPAGLAINTSNGEITGTPTVVGTFNVTISATNADGTGTAILVITISPKTLTVSNATADHKIYNRSAAATISNAILNGIVGADVVTISNTGTFANALVGTAKAVTSTQTLGGSDAAKYTLTLPTGLTASITPKALTIASATAQNKEFDNTTTATITGTLTGVEVGDSVTLSLTGTFASSAIGNAIAVTSTSTIGGTDVGNYTLTQPTGLTANITAPAPAPILQWNTFGNAGTETTEASVFNSTNLAASTLTQGSITPATNSNRFGGSGWFNTGDTNPSTLANAVAGNDYIQFIVTPNSGFSFTPTEFIFGWDRSTSGPGSVTLRSSVDGFTANLGTITSLAASQSNGNTITITGLTDLTTATTFRLYGYGGTATGGTGGFDTATNAVNVQLIGTTAIIPPSPALAVTGVLQHGVSCTNTEATAITYTITNSGNATASGISVGTSNTEFAVSGLSAASIAAGASATYVVTFKPTTAGSKTATITISSSNTTTLTNTVLGTGINNAPSVSTNTADNVQTTSARLRATNVVFGCPTTTVKGFVFSVTSTNANPLVGGTSATNFPVTPLGLAQDFVSTQSALLSETQYSYKAYLFDGTTYIYGDVQTFTTLSLLAAEPTVQPTNAVISNVTTTSMDVSWTAATTAPDGYIVTRRLGDVPTLAQDGTFYTSGQAIDANTTVAYIGSDLTTANTVLQSGSQYQYRIYAYNGTGVSVNYLTTGILSVNAYTLSLEPTAHPVTFTATAGTTSITLAFNAANTITNATGYLILRKTGSTPTGIPVDGNGYANNAIIGDATVVTTLTDPSTTSYLVPALTPGQNYFFTIIPFGKAGTTTAFDGSSNYYTNPTISSASAFLTNNSTVFAGVVGSEAVSVSSLQNETTITTNTQGAKVWEFTISDGGVAATDTDGLPTIITGLTISRPATSTVDFAGSIQAAALFDPSGTLVATSSSSTTTALLFSGLNITVPNNTTVNYSLRISLKTAGNQAAFIDGSDIGFSISTGNVTTPTDATSSKIGTFTGVATPNNTNVITVVASELRYVQNASTVNVNSPMAPNVVLEATDANGNRDEDFVSAITITSTGTLTAAAVVNAILGQATFPSLFHSVAGTGLYLKANAASFNQLQSASFDVLVGPGLIAGWDFFGTDGAVATATATIVDSNLNTPISLTRGLGATGSSGSNSFRTTGFQNNGIAVTNTDYFQTQLKAKTGTTLSLANINARVTGTAAFIASPGVSIQVAYSLDNLNFTLIGSPVISIGTGSIPQINLSGVTELQNVPSNTTVIFRFYASGQTSTGGFGFNSPSSGDLGLQFSGLLNCIQPAAFNVTSSGATCNSVTVGLSSSQVGINYQLRKDGVNVGSILAGTGSPLSFGVQNTVGIYTVEAVNTIGTCNLSEIMTGNATITAGACTTIWNGTEWTNNEPTVDSDAIIAGIYTSTGNLNAKSLTINSGAFTVATGHTLTVANAISNNAGPEGFVVQNNAVVLQTTDAVNTGLASVTRNSSNLYRQDYTLWSSPVSGQNLRAFSTMTLFNRFFTYNTAGGTNGVYAQSLFTASDVANTLFTTAKGYLIRMPSDWPEFVNAGTPGTPFVGIFRGTLNNGTISIPLSIANTGYNLVGNPYPSPISISAFFAGNSGIQQTLYFWRKRNGVPGSGYATTTELGLASAQSEVQGLDMQNTIKPGQGFFVKSTGSTNLTFTNTMRTNTASTPFLRTANTTELHRFWLNLSTATDVVGQTLIGYTTGASQGFDDGIDAPYFNDSPLALTSLIGGNEHIIQGRSVPFATTDVVPLGFKSDVANNFTISLSNFDGLFTGSQDIFLKDNLTGALQNLKLGDYTFSSAIGVFNTRFEVQFINTLGTDNPGSVSTKILVAVKDQVIKINAADVMIKKVDLVDVTGRVIYTQDDVNATTATIENILATNQMLIVRITTQSNGVLNQKIIY